MFKYRIIATSLVGNLCLATGENGHFFAVFNIDGGARNIAFCADEQITVTCIECYGFLANGGNTPLSPPMGSTVMSVLFSVATINILEFIVGSVVVPVE